MPLPVTRTLLMRPGFLCLPSQPTRLCTVVASGVAVTVFDRRQCMGGVGHYSHPLRVDGLSTPDFAAPALVGLIRMFTDAGSAPRHLEPYLYGGAANPAASGYTSLRGSHNLRTGYEILGKLGVRIAGSDVGGRFARKLVFYTGTGESILAKVDDIDDNAWYPSPSCMTEAKWA
ncbi:MAG: chemotaxis protein CheD [Planctomycetaceae bacterium]|nr:chemotaxis protein CheD [Planctomycetaceae bacterium]